MSFSLNEIEAMAKRATRGAGYSWGLAEEAAKATRWLCAQGLDGASELATVLRRGFPDALERHVPKDVNGDWQGEDDLCPLMTGAALSDHAAALQTGSILIRNVAATALLLPFTANVARRLNTSLTVKFDDCVAATDGVVLYLPDSHLTQTGNVRVATGRGPGAPRPQATRATPDGESWRILTGFAHRTYAPATEESRRLGAGSGLSDNE